MTAISTRAMQVGQTGGDFAPVQVTIPDPGPGQVRITIEACGVCHSDADIVSGHQPGVSFPVITGHEIAGRIESAGAGVEGWHAGDRVAVGWYGGSDGYCHACRDGDGINCPHLQIPGVAYPGGYAGAIVVPAIALARIPGQLTAAQAAPLACAGVTVFNALRRSDARPGDLVAILGVGGLGHLGGTLFDLPHVIGGARQALAGNPVTDRLAFAEGDFFASVPGDGDAYLLSHVLHDWDDAPAVTILEQCRKAMRPGGRILVIEGLIPDTDDPHPLVMLDVMLGLCTGGTERTEKEVTRLLEQAGLSLTAITPTQSAVSVLAARAHADGTPSS